MADGKWHMVTITTHTDKTTGFMLYLDGSPVGDMLQGNYTGMTKTLAHSLNHVLKQFIIKPVSQSVSR